MIRLDAADLVVIASEVLGCDTGAALAQADLAAADDALARARVAGRARLPGWATARARGEPWGGGPGETRPAPADAAEAAVALMDALLRHPPFPAHREQIAVAAALQFLAVNGWQAYLDVPRAAAIVIERLASGRVTPAQAASWLVARLSPDPASPARRGHRRGPQIVRAVTRRYRRRTRPSPFLVHIGPGDLPGGIVTPVTGPMAFTGQASRALILARRESSRLGRPRGPEHILLGLADVGDGLAVKALERLGVGPAAVRERVEQVSSEEPAYPPDIAQTRRVWQAMVDEAVAHGDDYIGTEHFLLALFCGDGNAAAAVLAGLGAGEREVRAAVADLLASSGRERSA
jgi:hypothetical protein